MNYPEGKAFAFSIFDDTDVATLDSIRPLYDYLHELGIFTTKTVWGLDYKDKSNYSGSHTLENDEHARYIVELRRRGFEIGFHGATMETAARADIEKAIDIYTNVLGSPPSIYAAHSFNQDNLYWGAARFSFALTRAAYARMSGEAPDFFQGHQPSSPYFWGDLAQRHLEYMRSFTFPNINLLNLRVPLVYQKDDTPWIKRWFISGDAENVEEFNALLSSANQAKLERERGIAIISTHLGKGFVDKGRVHPKTKMLLKELSLRNGWFVPVSTILDWYVDRHGIKPIGALGNAHLETLWFAHSIKRRFTRKNYVATESQYLQKTDERKA